MRPTLLASKTATAALVAAALLTGLPATAEAQRTRRADSSPGESNGGGRQAVARGGDTGGGQAVSQVEGRRSGRTEPGRRPQAVRGRDDRRAVGRAVPRFRAPSPRANRVIMLPRTSYGSYYPWGYGGLGFGGYWGSTYGGFYDPWGYGAPRYYPQGGVDYYPLGSLRLKVKPQDATVFVDGYYAGRVDDFDGVFQQLRIETGPHQIEIRAEGYEPLTFDVRILPNRKVTYDGELRKVTP